jgi:DNA ligase (NAD+)
MNKDIKYYIKQVARWKNPASGMTLAEKEELYLAAKDIYYDADADDIMTDGEFDTLEAFLKQAGSAAVNQVGGGGAGQGKLQHRHMSPMLSLDKIQVNDESNFPIGPILDFAQRYYPIEASPKFDGTAIELNYEGGALKQALTRGKNGKGADVTKRLALIVPAAISEKRRCEIRGEVLMTKATYLAKYTHMSLPRSVASGIVNSEDGNMLDCVFMAYSMKIHEGNGFSYPKGTQSTLEKLGFNKQFPVKTVTITKHDQFEDVYKEFKHYREKESPFFLDGIVLKTDEKYREELGENNHHPHWAVAIKFPSEVAKTKLTDIEWNVGYVGAVSPVGILEPVKLDGSTIRRVSLYNVGSILKSGTFPGAAVSIKKSGDIIPQIISVDAPSPDQAAFMTRGFFPHNCPSCGSKLRVEVSKDGHNSPETLWCDNDDCLAKQYKKLCNGIDALELKGIGESKALSLVQAGVVTIFDFFNPAKMNKAALIKSGQFVEGRELEILLAIPASLKETEFENVIRALQFPNLGRTGAKFVAKMLVDKNPFNGDYKGLERAVINPFLDKASKERGLVRGLVNLLRGRGVAVHPPKDTSHLVGFEMTGSPDGSGFSKKDDFVKFASQHGFVHTKLTEAKVLVTDDLKSSSSKMAAARKKGVMIVTYEQMRDGISDIQAQIQN